jgi:hypothetical protein
VDGVPADLRVISLGPLPNRPFAIDDIDPRVTIATTTRDLTHLFYTNRAQIHGGANDRFALLSDAGGLSMGYYSAAAMEETNLWEAAGAVAELVGMQGGVVSGVSKLCDSGGCTPDWRPRHGEPYHEAGLQ